MKKMILISFCMILAALTALAINPRDMSFSPIDFDAPEPERWVTDNGMTIFFLEDHQLPVVTATMLIRGGQVYDPAGKSGLAEITAALLRSGGAGDRTPDQVDAALDFVGANISSNASKDALTVDMSTLKKDLDTVFGIFTDMLIRPMFDSAKTALEISNRKDRILRQNDDPESITRRVYYETVYQGHPYGLYPTLASIGNISRNDIFAFHKKFYSPGNCILAVSGDMTINELNSLVGKYFSGWKQSGEKIEPVANAEMKYRPGVYYACKDINQAHIRFGHLGMDMKNPDRFAMEIMNYCLGSGGFMSRLTKQVRTSSGLAYSVGSYNYLRPLGGTYFSYCLTRADAMAQATTMMMDIIREVKKNGITAEEMEIARDAVINSSIFEYDTPSKIVTAKARLEYLGFPPDQMEKNIESYKAVTLEECNRAAQKYLDTDNIAIIITGNKELFDKPLETFGPVTEVSMEIK